MKLWPNGEISIYSRHKQKNARLTRFSIRDRTLLLDTIVRVYGVVQSIEVARCMGLSYPRDFDKSAKTTRVIGAKGITSLGKRRVRNACYMLTRSHGKSRLTFSTVTLPSMTPAQLSRVCKEWHKCVEFYRREMSRQLKRGGLSGELIGVTEVQGERYEKTGYPVLHAHFVFCGRSSGGAWVINPKRHDYIWRKSIENVLPGTDIDFSKSCQLKSVKESAEAYLSKYMSKGAKEVKQMIEDGFAAWIPKQWWSCSRPTTRKMENSIVRTSHGCLWLLNRSKDRDCDLFCYFKPIDINIEGGKTLRMGYFGRLTKQANGLIRKVLNLQSLQQYATL